MSASSSRSATQASTTTINEDARVAGAEGITLGKAATLNINQDFGEDVAKAFNSLIDFARDAGQAAVEISETAVQATAATQQRSLDTIAETAERAEMGTATIFQDLFPLFVVGLLGIGAIIAFKK